MKALILILLTWSAAYTQQPAEPDPDGLSGNMLETLSEHESSDAEDDHRQQQLLYYRKHPLSLNAAPEVLADFPLLDFQLIQNLLLYRKLFGHLVSIYELQAVPGFSVEVIKPILPFVTVALEPLSLPRLKERFRGGKSQWLLRPAFALQRTKDDVTGNEANKFTGSNTYLLARYKYQYRDLLQIGFTAEKDAGEPLLHSKSIPLTDFSSAHLFARNAGFLKTIALGDFTVNLGQGLILWQSQSFGKTSAVMNVKRQAAMLRPYQSTGEHNFFRGAAASFSLRGYEITFFSSWRKLTANTVEDHDLGRVFTSINTSGLHRSVSERSDKSAVLRVTHGGSGKWSFPNGHIGMNLVSNSYSMPQKNRDEPYRVFSIRGRQWINGSFDFSYSLNNHLFFGEAAIDRRGSRAMITGMITSLGKRIDVAIVNRVISRRYQSLFGNAFTENSPPSNETGTYLGLSLKNGKAWKLDLYADVFKFPWLKYRMDAPGSGYEYVGQLAWTPSRKTEIYSRYRVRSKPLNKPGNLAVDYPEAARNTNWRTHFAYQVSPAIKLRARMESCTYWHATREKPEYGSLFYADVVYKPMYAGYSMNLRLQFFETDGYNTRIYAYENDLYLASSIPAFFDKGMRCYYNFRTRIVHKIFNNNNLILSLKFSSTVCPDKTTNSIGSNALTTPGNSRPDVRLQLFFDAAH